MIMRKRMTGRRTCARHLPIRRLHMLKTAFSKIALVAAAVLCAGSVFAQAPDKLRIGYAISKTGPFAGGASVTTLPT
jgi:hypothetical protein